MAKKAVKAGAAASVAAKEPERAVAVAFGDDNVDTSGVDEEVETGKGKKKEVEEEYEILEPGTIIGDQHFPLVDTDKKKYKDSERMIVKLVPSEAQRQQLGGIRLRRRAEE